MNFLFSTSKYFDTGQVRGAGGMGLRLRGVYVDAALMAHDCLTNVHLSVDDNFVMTIRACVDIPAGNPVLYNYTDPLQVRTNLYLSVFHMSKQCKSNNCFSMLLVITTEAEEQSQWQIYGRRIIVMTPPQICKNMHSKKMFIFVV